MFHDTSVFVIINQQIWRQLIYSSHCAQLPPICIYILVLHVLFCVIIHLYNIDVATWQKVRMSWTSGDCPYSLITINETKPSASCPTILLDSGRVLLRLRGCLLQLPNPSPTKPPIPSHLFATSSSFPHFQSRPTDLSLWPNHTQDRMDSMEQRGFKWVAWIFTSGSQIKHSVQLC